MLRVILPNLHNDLKPYIPSVIWNTPIKQIMTMTQTKINE